MEEEHDTSLLRTVPGVARNAAGAYLRAARWTVHASRLAGSRLVRAALIDEEPARPEEPATRTPEAAEAEREEARKSLRERG